MTIIKTIAKRLLKIFIYTSFYILILTILHHFDLINQKVCDYLRFIGFIVILFFNSNNMSRKINKNNLLNGFLLGLSIIIIFLILTLLMRENINSKTLIYYLLILGVSVLSSNRGKSKKSR